MDKGQTESVVCVDYINITTKFNQVDKIRYILKSFREILCFSGLYQNSDKYQKSDQIVRKSKFKVCFIVNSATCTAHTFRELKLRYS